MRGSRGLRQTRPARPRVQRRRPYRALPRREAPSRRLRDARNGVTAAPQAAADRLPRSLVSCGTQQPTRLGAPIVEKQRFRPSRSLLVPCERPQKRGGTTESRRKEQRLRRRPCATSEYRVAWKRRQYARSRGSALIGLSALSAEVAVREGFPVGRRAGRADAGRSANASEARARGMVQPA